VAGVRIAEYGVVEGFVEIEKAGSGAPFRIRPAVSGEQQGGDAAE
jgi:hypothetical protein